MRPFTFHKIILLLFLFGVNNLYAVKPATVDQEKTESVATVSTQKVTKESPRKSKRKSKLVERFKEKFSKLFPQDNTPQNEGLETKTHGLAIASLVLGILGLLTFFVGIGFLFALLAIIFGAISKGKIRNSGGFYTGKGMATAGLVLGIIPMALLLIVFVIAGLLGGF